MARSYLQVEESTFMRRVTTMQFKKLANFFLIFECLSEERNVHDMWDNFKNMLLKLVSAHIPNFNSLQLKKHKQPWVTTHILKFINKTMKSLTHSRKANQLLILKNYIRLHANIS